MRDLSKKNLKSNFNIILFQPKIPPNTGNIIRLCSNTNSSLHLIKPLGFEIDDKSLRRAGLDYYKNIIIEEHESIQSCLKFLGSTNLYLVTKFGQIKYSEKKYKLGDSLLFGSEDTGLPQKLLTETNDNDKVYIPMNTNNRSLNLSNAVSICVYEAWKQNNFKS